MILWNNQYVASGSFDFTIKIWNIFTGILNKTLIDHNGPVRALAVLSNGDLVSGSQDTFLKIWDVELGIGK